MKRDLMGRSRTNFARKPTAGKKTRRGGGLVLGLPLDKQPQSLLPAARALTIELMLPAGDLLGLMEEYAVLLQGRSVIKNVASSTACVPMPMQHMPMPRLCQGCAVILFIFVQQTTNDAADCSEHARSHWRICPRSLPGDAPQEEVRFGDGELMAKDVKLRLLIASEVAHCVSFWAVTFLSRAC